MMDHDHLHHNVEQQPGWSMLLYLSIGLLLHIASIYLYLPKPDSLRQASHHVDYISHVMSIIYFYQMSK